MSELHLTKVTPPPPARDTQSAWPVSTLQTISRVSAGEQEARRRPQGDHSSPVRAVWPGLVSLTWQLVLGRDTRLVGSTVQMITPAWQETASWELQYGRQQRLDTFFIPTCLRTGWRELGLLTEMMVMVSSLKQTASLVV